MTLWKDLVAELYEPRRMLGQRGAKVARRAHGDAEQGGLEFVERRTSRMHVGHEPWRRTERAPADRWDQSGAHDTRFADPARADHGHEAVGTHGGDQFVGERTTPVEIVGVSLYERTQALVRVADGANDSFRIAAMVLGPPHPLVTVDPVARRANVIRIACGHQRIGNRLECGEVRLHTRRRIDRSEQRWRQERVIVRIEQDRVGAHVTVRDAVTMQRVEGAAHLRQHGDRIRDCTLRQWPTSQPSPRRACSRRVAPVVVQRQQMRMLDVGEHQCGRFECGHEGRLIGEIGAADPQHRLPPWNPLVGAAPPYGTRTSDLGPQFVATDRRRRRRCDVERADSGVQRWCLRQDLILELDERT